MKQLFDSAFSFLHNSSVLNVTWAVCEVKLPPKGLKILQNSSTVAANATAALPPAPAPARREVKGNLTCADPGCAADVLLQVYDPVEDNGKRFDGSKSY